MIITIDGPSGAGKSSVSKELSRRLGFDYLDTGAMYRAVALFMKERGIDLSDRAAVADALKGMKISFEQGRIFLNGRDVSDLIRTPEMDMAASKVSAIPEVRQAMTRLQRSLAAKGDIIAEGRDMGTVVLPNAELKIFLSASAEERAKRRKRQLEEAGQTVSYETILRQIKKRDKNDSNRDIAPLCPAEDAVVIDSSDMDFQQVVEAVVDLANKLREKKRG